MYEALIDTGTSDTLLSKKVINDLALKPTDESVMIHDSLGNEKESKRNDENVYIKKI